jgi:hypothetical protein
MLRAERCCSCVDVPFFRITFVLALPCESLCLRALSQLPPTRERVRGGVCGAAACVAKGRLLVACSGGKGAEAAHTAARVRVGG